MKPFVSVKHLVSLKYYFFAVVFSLSTLLLADSGWLQRWDNLYYDTVIANHPSVPHDDIVLVVIDDASIHHLGSWPWPRKTHAELINTLTQSGAKIIAFDILFTEPDTDNPQNDAALANAVGASGKVVFPVYLEQIRLQGQLRERLPLPKVTAQARALGHIHIELDSDGIARSVFLKAGLGDPVWPSFPLAIAQEHHAITLNDISYSGFDPTTNHSPYVWNQDYPVRFPFAGPPGTIKRISYSDVLNKRFVSDVFQDKYVLIGITASGESDRFPTPVSLASQLMPGVELFANILSSLIAGKTITEMHPTLKAVGIVLPVLLVLLAFPHLMPLTSALVTVFTALGCLLMSYCLLLFANIWISPVATALVILCSYPIWTWFRLESTVTYLRTQIAELSTRHRNTLRESSNELQPAIEFLAKIFSLKEWVLIDHTNENQRNRDTLLGNTKPILLSNETATTDNILWRNFHDTWTFGLAWPDDKTPSDREIALLDSINPEQFINRTRQSSKSVEVVQKQIDDLDGLSKRLNEFRRIIDDGLSYMADGVLIISQVGKVLVANTQARTVLNSNERGEYRDQTALDALANIQIENNESWHAALAKVLLNREEVSVSAEHADGKHLYIQLSPIISQTDEVEAVVFNFSDISELKATERKRAEILSFLSHDLRSPLVSVLALLEVASRQSDNNGFKDVLQRIETYTKSTLQLSEQFVDLIRAEIVQAYKVADLDLAEVATNAIEQLWGPASKKNIKIVHENNDEEFWMRGDPELIERALINLLGNAIKYSEPSTQVRLSISEREDTFCCAVTDQGCGIPVESLPTLFDLYQRVSRPKRPREKGTGLGLAFVKAVAERHAGSVTVKSIPGEGSTFTLCFPYKATPE